MSLLLGGTFLAIVTEYQYKEGPKRNPVENIREAKGMGFIPRSTAYFLNKYDRINMEFESRKIESIWSDFRNLCLVVRTKTENKINCNAVINAIKEVIVSTFNSVQMSFN